MKMSGERVIPAPQARVWEALNDPEILKQSIPGCQEMVKHSPTEFSAKVMAKVGPVKANFAGDVTLSDLNPPDSYRISGKGTGGAAGFAEGGAEVRLEEAEGGTRLLYDVDAKVGGKLAQIGSRLIDSTARKMADDFFRRFSEAITGGEPQPAPESEAVVVPDPAAEPEARAEPAAAAKPPAKKSPAAKKTAAKKTAAKKSAAKKAPAKKAANGKAAARPKRGRQEAEERPEFATEPDAAQPPSLMPEAAIATSASSQDESRRTEQQQAPSANNIWWLVGAGVAALLVILVLANV